MGKVKEIKRTANVAWSPRLMQSIYIAGGTVAQQLDATFSTSAHIELFSLDLSSPTLDMPCVGRIESKHRFHKLIWSSLGLEDGSHQMGVIVGGSDNGTLTIWDADKILKSDSDGALISQTQQHVGAVRTIDCNPFQPSLIASGASESEVFIWDINNPTSPMSPGNKLHPLEDITCVAWNRQVQHILGSTSPSGRSVVWDLRKNEPIIQVSDSSSRIHCKAIAWHPDIATQMLTASEDDRNPIIQLWDLRYATAPMRTLERHKRGVLSVAWCQQDADLLLSAAKDNQVLCWNPNSDVPDGEVVYQLPATTQWIFECHWCPRNPDIICTASFDGHVSLYSLLGGGRTPDDMVPKSPIKVDPSDPFSVISYNKKSPEINHTPLKTPPKWFRRPCAASFGFGGKLVSFGRHDNRTVEISQIITEPLLLQQSTEFEEAVKKELFTDYCSKKIKDSPSEEDNKIWNFLKAAFDDDPRRQYLHMLGYDTDELDKQFSQWVESSSATVLNTDDLTEKLAVLPIDDTEEEKEEEEEEGDVTSTAGLFGSEACGNKTTDIFDDISTSSSVFEVSHTLTGSGLPLSTGDDSDGMLTKALLVGNFNAAVNICINTKRMAEAIILSLAGGSDLYHTTQQLFFKKNKGHVTQLISLVTNQNWNEIVRNGNLDNWQEILAALVTYASPNEFPSLCDQLGKRLEAEVDGSHDDAALCYICSGNIDQFVSCWMTSQDGGVNPLVLQDLIEKVVLLRQAINKGGGQVTPTNNPILRARLQSYASLMASQGSLTTALSYVEITSSHKVDNGVLHDRLFQSLGNPREKQPPFPFERIDIHGAVTTETTNQYNSTSQQSSTTFSQPIRNQYQPEVPIQDHMTNLTGHVTHGAGGIPSAFPYQKVNYSSYVPPVPPVHMYSPSSPVTPPLAPPPGTDNKVAWNDPPMLRKQKQPTSYITPKPLTIPQAPPQDPLIHQMGSVQTVNKPSTPINPEPPSPVTPIEKKPLPSEHAVISSVFDNLLYQCRARANNAVTRRKVDDISRKLEVLSDLLRDSCLSPDILQGLHYIVQDTQSMNYQSALGRLNYMVANSNLSEISSFMPGIKTLLQLVIQLRI